MTVQYWSPSKFLSAAADVEIWNRLIGFAGAKLPLLIDKAFMTLELTDVPADSRAALSVTTGSIDGLVLFESFPFKALFGIDYSVEDLGGLTDVVREAMIDGMVQFVTRAVPAPYGEWRRRAGANIQEASRLQWARVDMHGLAGDPVQFRIGLPRDKLIGAVRDGVREAQPLARGLMSGTPVFPAVTLMRATMSMAGLKSLRPGSFVLLPDGERPTVLRLNDQFWYFGREANGWAFRGTGPADVVDLDPAREGTSDVSDAEGGFKLPVDFDIGRVQVTIADIDAWKPGSVVMLNAPEAGDGLEVTISVNGSTVGAGELVKVEDRFAIRITRLSVT